MRYQVLLRLKRRQPRFVLAALLSILALSVGPEPIAFLSGTPTIHAAAFGPARVWTPPASPTRCAHTAILWFLAQPRADGAYHSDSTIIASGGTAWSYTQPAPWRTMGSFSADTGGAGYYCADGTVGTSACPPG